MAISAARNARQLFARRIASMPRHQMRESKRGEMKISNFSTSAAERRLCKRRIAAYMLRDGTIGGVN